MLCAPILQFMTSCQLIYGLVVNFLSHLSNIYWNILFLTDKVLYKTSVKTKGNSLKYLLLPNLLLWFFPASRLQNNKPCYAQPLSKVSGKWNILEKSLKQTFIWKVWKILIYSTLGAGPWPDWRWLTQWFPIFWSEIALLFSLRDPTISKISSETNFISLVGTSLIVSPKILTTNFPS